MLERAVMALVFAAILLAMSEVSPFGAMMLWLWVADALRAWILYFDILPPDYAAFVSYGASSVFILLFVWLATLAVILAAEKRAET